MEKSHRIFIEEEQKSFICSKSQTIMQAAIAQGNKSIDRGCLGGGCGMCKVRVVSGEYELGRSSIQALPPEEREQGYVLACKTVPKSDLTLRVKNILHLSSTP